MFFALNCFAQGSYDQQRMLALIQQYMMMQQAAAAANSTVTADQHMAQMRLAQQIMQMAEAARAQGVDTGISAALPPNLLQSMTASQAAITAGIPQVSLKRPGVKRIAIAYPRVIFGAQVPGDTMAEPVRQTIASYLHGPSLESVPLQARLPTQTTAEAQGMQADYVLHISLTRKENKKGGMLGGLASKAAPALVMIPGGGMVAAQAKAAAAQTAASAGMVMSSLIKDKDELTLEYRLVSTDGASVKASSSVIKKAGTAGEDILTPLVEQAATAIGAALNQ
jgi:hypothetical protein